MSRHGVFCVCDRCAPDYAAEEAALTGKTFIGIDPAGGGATFIVTDAAYIRNTEDYRSWSDYKIRGRITVADQTDPAAPVVEGEIVP